MEEYKDETFSVNIKAFFQIIWKEKTIVLITTIFIALLGVMYALLAREEFSSSGKILPEIQSKSAGGLSQFAGLASLAGVDFGSMSGGGVDAVRPDLYPDLLKATPFFLELSNLKVKSKDGIEQAFASFYDKYVLDNNIKEEDKKLKFPISKDYIAVNYQTEKNLKDLRKRIIASYDKKTGVITIDVKMPDPLVAAQVTTFSMKYLTDYIITYRTEKAKKDLQFLADRLNSAKGKYYSNQEKKAQYSDQFQLGTIKLQSADIQRERIESEYKLTSNIYNGLLQKYEEAKMKLQQETPVLKVLEPPVVPNKRTEPKRLIVVALAGILGIILGIAVALIRKSNYRLVIESQS